MAAKAAALMEETVTSCDAAAYTWHSSITYGVRRPDPSVRAAVWLSICGRARWKSLSIIWHPFYLGAASPWWNSERLCLAWCDPCPLIGCQQKTTWNSPRAQMSRLEKGKFRAVTFKCSAGYCADLLLWPSGALRSGCNVYFCQPALSDRFNYTLINQV